MESNTSGHQEYKIAGHSVLFPCKPYPSQFSMMNMIIKGIERSQNCLLESPTGSGKSLALLCAALAWQASEKRKIEMENQSTSREEKTEACQCSCHAPKLEPNPPPCTSMAASCTATLTVPAVMGTVTSMPEPVATPNISSGAVSGDSALGKSVSGHASSGCDIIVIDDDSDADFAPLRKFREPSKSNMVPRKKKARLSIEYEDSPLPSSTLFTSSTKDGIAGHHTELPPHHASGKVSPNMLDKERSRDSLSSVTPCSQCSCDGGKQKVVPKKVPKIFFGTRTHKQITQIVRELRKTAYHDVSMTILASREHTCIHPQVSNMANKNEGCQQLVKDVGCRFKDRMLKYQSQPAIKGLGLHTAWDLEDLVELLKTKKACPYFVSHGLKDQSDVIICPYNYLVDPIIRDSIEINLKGQIVLLDEAHNIEDSSREAASQSITQEQIQKALADMDGLIEKGEKIADVSKLRQMCHKLDRFIEEKSSSLTQHDFEQSYSMWSGFDIIAQLNTIDLGPQHCEPIKAAVLAIKAAEQEEKQYSAGADVATLAPTTWSLLEQVFLVLRYLYKDNMKYAEDYRMSIVKSIQYVPLNPNGSWLNSKRHFGKKTPVEVFTLNFWCMNPAVGFADFESCRSVILASGTLSPMDTFQSELGQPFPIVLEANHIIQDSQVWVGAVGQGPDGTSLQAVYRNMESFAFQDSLGQLILRICTTIPKGILCFLPSYKALEKLTSRWKATGLWAAMERHKCLLCEPRRSDKVDFEQIIQGYYSIIQHSDDNGENSHIDGAVFFAVCRGKVSEGLDFADNFARAVITVGIPYPNFKDIQVELKRKYNDKHHLSRRLLSGSLWYEIQAFRALNQALGRCIRHRKDWGALIIVDDRFVKNSQKYSGGLSKWVRQKLKVHGSCSSMLNSLCDFTHNRQQAQKEQMDESLNASKLSSTPQTRMTPTSLGSPPWPVTDVHPTDSRGPLHDVSNMVTTVSPSTPCPVTHTAASPVESSPAASHVSKTGNFGAQNKGRHAASVSGRERKQEAPSMGMSAPSSNADRAVQEGAKDSARQPSKCQSGDVQETTSKSPPSVQESIPLSSSSPVNTDSAVVKSAAKSPSTAGCSVMSYTPIAEGTAIVGGPDTTTTVSFSEAHLNTHSDSKLSVSDTAKIPRDPDNLRQTMRDYYVTRSTSDQPCQPESPKLSSAQTSPQSASSTDATGPSGQVSRKIEVVSPSQVFFKGPRVIPGQVTLKTIPVSPCQETLKTITVNTGQAVPKTTPVSSDQVSFKTITVNTGQVVPKTTFVSSDQVTLKTITVNTGQAIPKTVPVSLGQETFKTINVKDGQVVPEIAPVRPDQVNIKTITVKDGQVVPKTAPVRPVQVSFKTITVKDGKVVPETTPVNFGQKSPQATPVSSCQVSPNTRSILRSSLLEQVLVAVSVLGNVPKSAGSPRIAGVHSSSIAGNVAPAEASQTVPESPDGATRTLPRGGAVSPTHRAATPQISPGFQPETQTLFLPVSDPSFQPVTIQLPSTESLTTIKLPSDVVSAVGWKEVIVPPDVRWVVFGNPQQRATSILLPAQTVPVPPLPAGQRSGQDDDERASTEESRISTGTQKYCKSLTLNARMSALQTTSVTGSEMHISKPAGTPASLTPSKVPSSVAAVVKSETLDGATSPSLFEDSLTSPPSAASQRDLVKLEPESPSSGKKAFVSEGTAASQANVSGDMTCSTSAGAVTLTSIAEQSGCQVVVSPSVSKSLFQESTAGGPRASVEGDSKEPNTNTSEKGARTLLRKPLFRNTPRKRADSCSSDQSAEQQRIAGLPGESCDLAPNSREVEDASAMVKYETEDPVEAGEGEVKVERRVRGAKRRSLSLGGSSRKKRSTNALDNIAEREASCMKCTTCDLLLLEGIKESDFEHRDMPTYLSGMISATRPEMLYFKGNSVTERLKVPSTSQDCQRLQSSGDVEAKVELICCPGCVNSQATATTVLGAKVTLGDPIVNASTHQMWIFSHKVTLSATSASL